MTFPVKKGILIFAAVIVHRINSIYCEGIVCWHIQKASDKALWSPS